MDKKAKIDKRFLEYISIYLSNSISNFFNSLDVELPKAFLAELKQGLKEVAKEYSRFSLKDSIKIKYDYFTIRTLKLDKILGFEKTAELSEKAFAFCFNLIVEKETTEIISGLVKNERNFSVLVHCFENYLKNALKKRFIFYNQLNSERQELLYEKIVEKILNNSNHFVEYDSSKSKFRTFLFHALEYAAYITFREEGFEINNYTITERDLLAFIDSASLQFNPDTLENFEPGGTKNFFSRQDVLKWLNELLDEKEFESHKNLIWKYVKPKSDYKNSIIDIENYYLQNITQDFETGQILTQEEKVKFIKVLKNIEKNDLYRTMLKLRLGLNINYLNYEINLLLEKEKINLELLKRLTEILTISTDSNNKIIFETYYEFFSEYSIKIRNVTPNAIKRRIYRCYEKIRELYAIDDFSRVLGELREGFDLSLLESPPEFLIIKNESELEKLSHPIKLRTLDMSNNNLQTIPDVIFNFTTLKELDLSNNMIRVIPKDIGKLTGLVLLDLRNQYNKAKSSRNKAKFDNLRIELDQLDKMKLEGLLPGCNILFN